LSGAIKINVLVLGKSIARAIQETYRWHAEAPLPIPGLRPGTVVQELATVPVADAGGAGGGELALAPVTSGFTGILASLGIRDRRLAKLKDLIFRLGANNSFNGARPEPFMTAGVHAGDLSKLEVAGYLQLVTDEFGETQISLRAEAICWQAGRGLISVANLQSGQA